jgi:hypothetical protein
MANVTHINYVSVSAAKLLVTDQINIDKLIETAIKIPCFNGKNFKMFLGILKILYRHEEPFVYI